MLHLVSFKFHRKLLYPSIYSYWKTWESFLTPYFISYLSTDSQANLIWSIFKLYLDSDLFSPFLLLLSCSKVDFFNCLLTGFPTSTFALTTQWILNTKARMSPLKFKQYLITPKLKILQFPPILLKLTYLVLQNPYDIHSNISIILQTRKFSSNNNSILLKVID